MLLAAVLVAATIAQVAEPRSMIRINVAAVEDGSGGSAESLTASDFRITAVRGKREQQLPVVYVRRSLAQPVLVVLDLFSTRLSEQGQMLQDAAEAIRGVDSGDRVYLYLLTEEGQLRAVHGLPSTERQAAIPPGAWASDVRALLDESLQRVSRTKQLNLTTGQRVNLTYAALEKLGSGLAAIPGHKNILWISRGVPIGFRDIRSGNEINYRNELTALSKTLDQCDVSVSTSDLPAVVRSVTSDNAASREFLQTMASFTGGRYFAAGFGVQKAIAEVVRAASSSYTVGFDPQAAALVAGKATRQILVSTTRPSSVRLLMAPTAYLEYPRSEQDRVQFEGAVASLFDASEIHVIAHVTHAAGDVWRLQAGVAPQDLVSEAAAAEDNPSLAFALVSIYADGHRTVSKTAGGGEYSFPSDVQKIRVVVADQRTGAIGSKTMRLTREP